MCVLLENINYNLLHAVLHQQITTKYALLFI